MKGTKKGSRNVGMKHLLVKEMCQKISSTTKQIEG